MTRIDLPQECIDELAIHLEKSGISEVALLKVLERLPDFEYGRGDRALDVNLVCAKCDEEIADEEIMGTAFGSFYHEGCVPRVDGPMPAGQYLAGVESAEGSR